MSASVLSVVQISLSMWEIWMCYQLLYLAVFEEQYNTKVDKIVMWFVVILVGGILGINRLITFFLVQCFFSWM